MDWIRNNLVENAHVWSVYIFLDPIWIYGGIIKSLIVHLIAHEVFHRNSKDSNPLTPLSKKKKKKIPPTLIIVIVELATKKKKKKG